MAKEGWDVITLRRETVERIRAFQVLAISRTGKMLTLSATIDLAMEMAAEKLTEGK